MKAKLFCIYASIAMLTTPVLTFAQAPTLGSSAGYALFTTNGAMGNTGISQITGNVGSNNGSSTAFGNVNGVMNNNNGATALCAADLLTAYNQLNSSVATFFPAPLLGNGTTLNAGVYSITGNTTLNNTLTLDGQSNSGAVFIFKIQGAFASSAGAKVILTNGALACNVFWKIEGAVNLASLTSMKGTIIANNAAISMSSGVTLEGRALSTAGAVSVSDVLVYTPIGCGSPFLTGPNTPTLNSVACYALFSGNGSLTNTGNTHANGDVGTNVGLTTGFNALYITGAIHPIPDGSTGACAADLLTVYNYLNLLPYDIELLYPAQFGKSLVLTPHIYTLNGSTTLTDTLFLNAQGNANAVFVINVQGAFSTSTYAQVILKNGTQAKNVFWKIDGATSINNFSHFAGTIICNNGAVSLNKGMVLNGRALTTDGAFSVDSINVIMPPGCSTATNTGGAPNITMQPANKVACLYGEAKFVVAATGSGLTYQWRKGNTLLSNTGNVSGVMTATLTISPLAFSDAAANYNVIVNGSVAPADTSSDASLTVNDCGPVGIRSLSSSENEIAHFSPNPFVGHIEVTLNDANEINRSELKIFNTMGVLVKSTVLSKISTTLETDFAPGVYYYRVIKQNRIIQSGKLIAQ